MLGCQSEPDLDSAAAEMGEPSIEILDGPTVPTGPVGTVDPGLPPPVQADRILGVGFANSTGYAYAWTAANTVSAGIPAQLTWYRSPYRWSGSVASTPVEFAISSNDTTYVWYANGRVGKGSSSDPTSTSTYDYVLPGGRTPSQIVGMAIRKSNDRTYAYYSDGTYSTGTTAAPGSSASGTGYTMPPGKGPLDIVGLDFGTDGRMYTWFDDGTYSVGTAGNLDHYQAPKRYARHGMLASAYPASSSIPPGPPSSWPPNAYLVSNPTTVQQMSPPSDTFDISGSGDDLLVSAGRDALGVALDASVRFFNKDGTPLTGGILSSDGTLPLSSMYAEFVRKAPVAAEDVPAKDVNQYVGFAQPCDSATLPDTDLYKYCVASEPYDTRVEYDVLGDRWVVVAALRNHVWTNYFGNAYSHPDASDTELYAMPYGDEISNCGKISDPTGEGSVAVPSGAHCKEARRLITVAVSRTADPRDGFFTYVFLENNYRDWPWMAIDGDWLVISHRGTEDPAGPVSSLVSLKDLRAGRARPQYIHYFETDLQGYTRAEPPRQLGTLPSHTLLASQEGDPAFFAIPHPVLPYGKKAAGSLVLQSATLSEFTIETFTYRNGKMYMTKSLEADGKTEIQVARVPLVLDGDTPAVSTSAASGYKVFSVKDSQSLDRPITAMNGVGELFMIWGRHGTDPDDGIAPGPRHALWRPSASFFDVPRTFRGGDGYAEGGSGGQIKARACAVDPVDDRTFWAAHKYGKSNGGWGIVIGSVDPIDQ
jgi:hypothetical protein